MTSKMLNVSKHLVSNSLQSLFENRTETMGIAMLMVLLYHLKGTWFYPGFLGVDIFLFLSAYGLSRSYKTNTLGIFYKRRLNRVVPLYILMGVGISLVYCLFYHHSLTWLDVLCNITSLNYWGLGGSVAEWYLSFLLILYLLYPILHKVSHFFYPECCGRNTALTAAGGGGHFIVVPSIANNYNHFDFGF